MSKKLVDEILTSPGVFAERDSDRFPNSRRLPILCRMFERQGTRCETSHCVVVSALRSGVPLEESCEMGIVTSEENRGASP